jgi:CheY-like chemotaxis protein
MGAGARKILVVDDDMLILLALSRAYRSRLLDITTAANACHAMTLMESTRFDLFILDLDLHGHSGFELLAVIDERFPYIPVIITTAADVNSAELTGEIATIRKKGIWHLLEKPFRLELLNSLIEKNLNQAEDKLLRNLTHSQGHGADQRLNQRRPHIMPARFSYEVIRDGELIRETVKAILTDISTGGVGLLTDFHLEQSQIVRFDDSLEGRCGVVTWSAAVGDQTCRAGIHFC